MPNELIVDLFVSVDGFAAAEDAGPYFGYDGPQLRQWIAAELAREQIVLLGRRTWEQFGSFCAGAADDMSRRLTALPKAVVTRAGGVDPAAWPHTEVLHGPAAATVPALRERATVRTMGSLSLAQDLLAAGLADRLRVMVFPLLAGAAGRQPMSPGLPLTRLEPLGSRTLDGRITLLEFGRPPASGGPGR